MSALLALGVPNGRRPRKLTLSYNGHPVSDMFHSQAYLQSRAVVRTVIGRARTSFWWPRRIRELWTVSER